MDKTYNGLWTMIRHDRTWQSMADFTRKVLLSSAAGECNCHMLSRGNQMNLYFLYAQLITLVTHVCISMLVTFVNVKTYFTFTHSSKGGNQKSQTVVDFAR